MTSSKNDVLITSVAGNNILDLHEEQTGFSVVGTATGVNNQTVTVKIYNSSNQLVATETAKVDSHGNWTVNFPPNSVPGPAGTYSAVASVTTASGHNTYTTTKYFDDTACFMPGTLVRCPEGDVAIETLKIGDLVLTAEGKAAPVRWIGRQTVSLFFADKLRALPIRIRANALAENVPTHDLLISPDHAVLVGDVLVQAGALVNGTSIVRENNVPQVFTYYHVELDDHSLILAENVSAETFIDNVDRMAFDNWEEHEALYPDGKPTVEMSYPRAKAHRQVPSSIRAMLAKRAALIETAVAESAA